MMCKLYDHVSAPDSVAVLSLRGALLGYVPRRHTHRFVHDTNFGHVYAINQDAAGLWRLTVSIRLEIGQCMSVSGCLYVTAEMTSGSYLGQQAAHDCDADSCSRIDVMHLIFCFPLIASIANYSVTLKIE